MLQKIERSVDTDTTDRNNLTVGSLQAELLQSVSGPSTVVHPRSNTDAERISTLPAREEDVIDQAR